MRTVGVYLIFAAVVLRGLVVFMDSPRLAAVIVFFMAYGLLLVGETWFIHRKTSTLFQSQNIQVTYLYLQAALVIGLLAASRLEDFFALLFIPLSLDAVSFFGRRNGFIAIAIFSLAMIVTLLFSEEGHLFGLAMAIEYGGLCFLFGGYAHQVLKAQAVHDQNQRTFHELQMAHHQLQKYADQVSNLAMEHERNRLARDLHDSVTQTVFSMNLAAQSARLLLDKRSGSMDKEPLRVSGQLLRLEELAANALSEIQSLVSQLGPHSVVKESLPNALRRLANESEVRDGLHVSLEVHGEGTFSEAVTTGLFSIVHEALTNILKHSGVHEAIIRLNVNEGKSCLEIEDHGKGFDTEAMSNLRGHLGLAGMSERAREMGWSLLVESRCGQGTRICVMENQSGGSH
jgi:signal transduction histidine kinase